MVPRIDDFRKRKHLTQQSLADKLDCNQSLVAVWCKGKTAPTYDKICKLIDIGITLDELFPKELVEKLLKNDGASKSIPIRYDTPQFREGVIEVIMDMKKEGKL